MRERIVIIGAGGHAKAAADQIERLSRYEIVGCVGRSKDDSVCGVPIIGDDSVLPGLRRSGISYAFVAIGSNDIRARMAGLLAALGYDFVSVISPYAYVSPHAGIGEGAIVMPGAVVQAGALIGKHSIVNTGATVDHDSIVGDYCHIAPGCHLAGCVSVGDDTFLGVGTQVIDGIRIGRGCVLGAGAVVVSNIPDNAVAWGVPAKLMKYVQQALKEDEYDLSVSDCEADLERKREGLRE